MTTSPQPERLTASRRPTELLRELIEVSDAFEQRLARHLSVNPTDLTAMEHLIQDGSLSPGELARRLGVTAAAVTTVVDRLEAAGHASRSQHPTDRRAVLVTADPASVDKAMDALLPMIRDVDAALDGFTDDESATVQRYLEQVLAAYRQHV